MEFIRRLNWSIWQPASSWWWRWRTSRRFVRSGWPCSRASGWCGCRRASGSTECGSRRRSAAAWGASCPACFFCVGPAGGSSSSLPAGSTAGGWLPLGCTFAVEIDWMCTLIYWRIWFLLFEKKKTAGVCLQISYQSRKKRFQIKSRG